MPNNLVTEKRTRYRMGVAYIGYGNYRAGINSDRYVRHPIQDHFAHNWIGEKQPGLFESLWFSCGCVILSSKCNSISFAIFVEKLT